MLQVPAVLTKAVPSKVVPFAANRLMVLPGVPVPLMAGLALLVMPSPSTPLSLLTLTASLALKLLAARGLVLRMTLTDTAALVLPATSVELTLRELRPSTR